MQHHKRVLLLVAAGVFMSTLDSSMLNVALPSIMQAFSSSLALTEWVILIYLLTITVLLLFWGHLSKKFPAGRIYSYGVALFTLGSLLCYLGSTIYSLILFRFIQAAGASMMMAMGPALITATFPRKQLGQGLGQIGIATSLGLMCGPVISGLLIRWSHWRIIFLITVPVGLLVYLLGRNTLVNAAYHPAKQEKPGVARSPFDLTGALLWIVAITLSLLLTSHATSSTEDGNFFVQAAGILSAMLAWIFLYLHEIKTTNPLLPLTLLRKRFFSMALISAMLSFSVLFFILLLIPFYLRSIQQLSADQTGYVMMALPLSIFFISPIAGMLHDRIGARIVATTGLGFCFIALLLLTTLQPHTSPVTVALLLALLGFGEAIFLSPNSAAALSGVEANQTGVTSSLLATSRNMGMLTGTALAGLIFTLYFSSLTGGLDMRDFVPGYTEQFMVAMGGSFRAAAGIAAVGMAASWARGGGGGMKK
jgi:EmrB/QacA subfamily drug resistance transporter